MPHTYQVRDFVPKLATAMARTAISDCIGYKRDGDKLLFTRQMFQGKLAADVSFACDAPWFVTFQNGAFRGDKVEAGVSPAPVETVTVEIADGVIRNQPQEVFKEAKQAVDLTQAEIIVSSLRGSRTEKYQLAEAAAETGGELAASRPICDSGWLPMDRQIGSSKRCAQTLSRWHQRSHTAHRRHERRANYYRDQQRLRSADFRDCRFCRGRESVRYRASVDRGSEESQGRSLRPATDRRGFARIRSWSCFIGGNRCKSVAWF
jgi:hypothetical protein